MVVNVGVIVMIVVFYVIITIAGVFAARATRKRRSERDSETLMVGGRDIGLFLGICTMSATWTGGGALNGTAEAIFNPARGLIWCLPSISYGVSIALSGVCFAKKYRDKNYVTILDAHTDVLGRYFAAFFFIVECMGSIVYVAAILNALGGTLEVIAGLSRVTSILTSAGIAIVYTILGGIYSVAYTDVLQLALIFLGMLLIAPFALTDEAVSDISETFSMENGWLGSLKSDSIGQFIDIVFAALFGGIPIQASFQRLLAMDTTKNAQLTSVVGGILATILLIPPVFIGAAGASTNWTLTTYQNGSGTSPADLGDERLILPIVAQYLTPAVVGYLGLAAITAAVMSSADSAYLALAGEFGRNVYQSVFRPKASQREIVWVIRVSIVILGAISVIIALQVKSVLMLYILCTDFIYVLSWPALVSVTFLDINAYGTLLAVILGIIIRIGGGETMLNIPGPFHYPGGNNFPVKTFSMAITFLAMQVFSYLAKMLFRKEYISARYDVFSANLSEKPCAVEDRKNQAGEDKTTTPFI